MSQLISAITRQGFRRLYVRTGMFAGATVFLGNIWTECTGSGGNMSRYPLLFGTGLACKSISCGVFWPYFALVCTTKEGRRSIFTPFNKLGLDELKGSKYSWATIGDEDGSMRCKTVERFYREGRFNKRVTIEEYTPIDDDMEEVTDVIDSEN